jgi:dolichol-phosphate mannosyltransferase
MVLLLIGGLQLILLGVTGLYIGKIFEEIKHRPLYIVKESLGFREPS